MELRITRTHIVVLAVLALAGAGYLLLDWLIVTDGERLRSTMDELAAAVGKNDVELIMPFLDRNFRMAKMTPEEFHEWYPKVLAVIQVKEVSRGRTRIRLDESEPDVAQVTVSSTVELENPPGARHVDWQLEFQRRGEHDWKLRDVRAFAADGREVDLRNVLLIVRQLM